MFTVKRSATAVAALAVLLTACGGADGDVTTTEPTNGTETTQPPSEPTTVPPEESAEPEETTPPDDGGSGETRPPEDTGGSESGEPDIELTVRLDPGTGDISEWTVTCDPVGGTSGDPEAACETLESLSPRDVAPVPKDANCTMQYGGPQTARITGVWDGTKVDLSFSRQNGCEIARWEQMDPVLPAGDAATR